MTVTFYLRFSTKPGQHLFISGDSDFLGSDVTDDAVPLHYFNEEFWCVSLEVEAKDYTEEITYRYLLQFEDSSRIVEGENHRNILLSKYRAKMLDVFDIWNHAGTINNVFYTQPFTDVLLPAAETPKAAKILSNVSHEFKVKAPLLKKNETIFITGSGKPFGDWNMTKPVLLAREGAWHTVRLNLSQEKFPLTYKYGIYNTKTRAVQQYENGRNRFLTIDQTPKKITILNDGFVNLDYVWRGAGVAIPVFSLRSKNSFGVGEFMDLKLLTDWAKITGLKLIQILPINDTSATNTWQDSYPYAAISAFALHPIYINLSKVAGGETAVIKALSRKQKSLNKLDDVEYDQVMKFKLSALQEIFVHQKDTFNEDKNYFEFFDLNRHWLVPYAVFCYLKNKYKTSDFSKWRTNKIYSEEAIQKLAAPSQKHYDEILLQYFIQYHLHLQLKEAADYAHENSIILKGDIPIGVYRHGVDAWMNPELFNMDKQAGAPPDDFAVRGQNWGFPTYNWAAMKQDDFGWWRKRFEQMSNYFDAFRIDHILGFFRIWSIPLHAVEGIMGHFNPAIPVHINEFYNNGIWFDKDRYCNPFITENIVRETFGEDAEAVKKAYLEEISYQFYKLKPEFDTQQKVAEHFAVLKMSDKKIEKGLYNLISNVILFEVAGSDGQQFHFRISMEQTSSYNSLDGHTKYQLHELYVNYFFRRQDDFWRNEAMQKLPQLKRSTNMLVCGEDLGMVPTCVPDVMGQLSILSLEIQRMPKNPESIFFHPKNAPYLSVVTPSTHDMSTIRGWWEEDRGRTQHFYNYFMGHYGEAPYFCESHLNREIILQHLYSPAMWSIFMWQDLMGMDEKLRRDNPQDERINIPAEPNHYWKYRMHIPLEQMIKEKEFNIDLHHQITDSGR
ncbi:MAG: 4-alpha-glucanotransferase [Ginsengibacter sp.]